MKLILIVSDTFRRDHLGAYGNKWIHTPNLDRLAAMSTVFEGAHIGSFPTLPNRRDLFLGKGDKGVPFNRWKGLDRDEVTLAQRLGERKIPSMMLTDTANSVTNGMNFYQGFTAWFCNRGQEGDGWWLDDAVPLEATVAPDQIRYQSERWHQILVNRAQRRVETDWFAPGTFQLATNWLNRNHTRKDFLLYIDTFDPHEPWDPPQHYTDLYDPGYRGRLFEAPTYGFRKSIGMSSRELKQLRARYAGEVTMVDAAVGRLLAALENLNIADETMIVFTTDHGAYFDYPGDNGLICKPIMLGADGRIMAAGQPPPKPHQYFPNFPGTCRIPLMIHLPAQSKGQRIRAITQPWDLTPTVLEAFGMKAPPEFLGQSLLPLIRGKQQKIRDVAVLGSAGSHAQAMTGRWLYATWRGQREPVLHDMKADPLFRRNVLKQNPAVARRLHGAIVKFMRRQGIEEGLIAEYQ